MEISPSETELSSGLLLQIYRLISLESAQLISSTLATLEHRHILRLQEQCLDSFLL